MPLKMTTYSAGFEGDSRHELLVMLGSWQDENDAREAMRTTLGWDEIHVSPIFQVSFEVAAFAAFPTAEARDASSVPHAGAPRIFQHNALVVPA